MSKEQRKKKKRPKQIKFRSLTEEEEKSKLLDQDNNKYSESNPNKDDDLEINKKQKLSEINSCGSLWKWYMQDPIGHLPFLYFLISIFVPIGLALYYFMDNDTSYIVSGIFACTVALYGFNHFRILLNLRQEVNNFAANNRKFRNENFLLQKEVDCLQKANDQLKDAQGSIRHSNEVQKKTIIEMRKVEDSMKLLNSDNIKGINQLREKTAVITKKWKDELLSQERKVLISVFERFEYEDESEGMTKEEFENFSQLVPSQYASRFKRLGTFRKLAKGGNMLHYADFKSSLDLFAEMHVEDRDYDFKIEKLDKNKLSAPQHQLARQVSIIKTSKVGQQLTTNDIQFSDDQDDNKNDDNDDDKDDDQNEDDYGTDDEWTE